MENQADLNPVLTVGIIMPSDFPQVPYDAIHRYCLPTVTNEPPDGEKWCEYQGAWNAIAYRFRALSDHDVAYVDAIAGQNPEDRYQQERELFGFFVSGLATLEACCYGLYFLGSLVKPLTFPVENRRGITPSKTKDCYSEAFPNDPLTSVLEVLIRDDDYKDWRAFRNVLLHRSAPGRIISVGGESPRHDTWKLKETFLTRELTSTRRHWLASVLQDLLSKALPFVESHI